MSARPVQERTTYILDALMPPLVVEEICRLPASTVPSHQCPRPGRESRRAGPRRRGRSAIERSEGGGGVENGATLDDARAARASRGRRTEGGRA